MRLQQKFVELRQEQAIPDQLLLLEHPPVITLGRGGDVRNLLAPAATLDAQRVRFFETTRGGDITYHGPGQLVGYPILDLRDWKRDVGAYVRAVEQCIIDTLGDYGIEAGRIP
ncbi:MAG TPA: lipoyl(octanoyl) transferase LipB, partial [Thermoanaerobaculia bacterium]|nr:lipoyl(octanoyl) transferase LipB [Thermoanaerobaculia bacterium]